MQTQANVSTILDGNLEAGRADKTAIITATNEKWTFSQLLDVTTSVTAHLVDLGVRRGERVLLVLDDTPAFPAAFLGAMRMGAVPIPVNFLARADDFGYFLDDSYAVAAIVDAAFLSSVGPQLASRPHVVGIVANGEGLEISFDDWLKAPNGEFEPVATHVDDPAFWLYSSGSTGLPKAVMHRHASLPETARLYAEPTLGITEDDIAFSSTKMFHAYGLGNNLTFPLSVGATSVYLTGRPTPQALLERVATHRPTLYFSVPALFNAILSSDEFETVDWSSVRLAISAAEPLPPEIWRRFHERTGVEILDGLGSTEMLHIYCSNRSGEVRPGTSGVAVEGYELEIRDPESQLVAPGEAGELWVNGPTSLTGYWHQAERTRAKLMGEWFASGDRYHMDEDGYLTYEGRVDDMMKIGGLWVSPIEIENRLMEHSAVNEGAVVAVEVENVSRIKAFVILNDGFGAEESLVSELQDWCRQTLQRYQFPHIVEFVSDFPRTATGKTQRFRLRET
ncbi:MAG: benzoate-CoA ligase family protein [Acidimicrobiia bacterium]